MIVAISFFSNSSLLSLCKSHMNIYKKYITVFSVSSQVCCEICLGPGTNVLY